MIRYNTEGILRDSKGQVLKIVEHKNATKKERLVKEVNTSILCS